MNVRLLHRSAAVAISLALIAVLSTGSFGISHQAYAIGLRSSALDVAATGTTKVSVEVKYGQTEARSMLKMVNDFRTGSDAWAWDSSNANKVKYSGLGKLAYDYELERVAKLRAAEIALRFSHSRPNGDVDPWSAYPGGNYKGENIAAGYASAALAFAGWQETNENYAGQGHRRNMLGRNFTAIGIGHVVCNGRHYWVQEFCAPTIDTTKTAAADSASTVSLDVSGSVVTSRIATASPSSIRVKLGGSASLPSVSARIGLVDMWPSGTVPVKVSAPSWSCGDTSVASVSGGKVTARKVGKTTLSANVSLAGSAVRVSVPVEVVGKDIASASVAAIAGKTYTGSAIEPKSKVTYGSKTLVEGTDYTLSYKNNTNVGTATVTVKGKGNYSGSVSKTFAINPKGTSVSKLAAQSKGFTATWRKQATQTTGYQLQYSTASSFKSGVKTVAVSKAGTVSKKVSKLAAKKKYWVRVRTYKAVGKARYYSAWSAAKAVTTKK